MRSRERLPRRNSKLGDSISEKLTGQHTAEIVAAVSGSRDTPVWCMIYDELEYVEDDGHLLLCDDSGARRRYAFKEVMFI